MNLSLLALLVFAAAAAYDLSWARYLRAATEQRALPAAFWSVTVYAIGLIGLVGVLKVSGWLVVPEMAGLFVGTLLGVGESADVDAEKTWNDLGVGEVL